MVVEQQWEVLIGGQKGLVSLTTTFFGTPQRVLAAHFAAPNGDRYLMYQKTKNPQQAPDREGFLAVLETIRFEEMAAANNSEFIGKASMWPDGTIQLQLRAEDGSGTRGDAFFTYPKGHPRYEMILDHLGKPRSLLRFVADRPGHDRRYAIDAGRMQRELGWSPSVSFEEGIRETVQWYLDHQEWWTRVMTGEYQEYYQRNYHDA